MPTANRIYVRSA